MPNSVQPHRQYRLPRPWDSPGKNTAMGCHFLLQCMKVKSETEVAQSCPTLSDPMDCSLPGSSTRGIFQARVLEWVAIEFMKSKPKSTHRDRDDQRKRGFLLTSLGPFFVRDNAKDTLSQPAVFQFLHVAH